MFFSRTLNSKTGRLLASVYPEMSTNSVAKEVQEFCISLMNLCNESKVDSVILNTVSKRDPTDVHEVEYFKEDWDYVELRFKFLGFTYYSLVLFNENTIKA
jgi:hypothetical protein